MITGKDIAKRDGTETYQDWIKQLSSRMRMQLDTPFTGIMRNKFTVQARVDFGRWIADCPDCGGAEIVEPDEPLFYCFSCGNKSINGDARRVIFPKNMIELEGILSIRPVDDRKGKNKIEAALMAKPLVPGLSRSWNPDETAEDLKKQNEAIK